MNWFLLGFSNEDILIGEKLVFLSFWGYCGFEFLERWVWILKCECIMMCLICIEIFVDILIVVLMLFFFYFKNKK